jgi:hypothetical protein
MMGDSPESSRAGATTASAQQGRTVAPLTPELRSELPKLTPALAQGIRAVQSRKT